MNKFKFIQSIVSVFALILMISCFFLNLAVHEDKINKEYITFTLQYHEKSNGEWIDTDVSVHCDYFQNRDYKQECESWRGTFISGIIILVLEILTLAMLVSKKFMYKHIHKRKYKVIQYLQMTISCISFILSIASLIWLIIALFRCKLAISTLVLMNMSTTCNIISGFILEIYRMRKQRTLLLD